MAFTFTETDAAILTDVVRVVCALILLAVVVWLIAAAWAWWGRTTSSRGGDAAPEGTGTPAARRAAPVIVSLATARFGRSPSRRL